MNLHMVNALDIRLWREVVAKHPRMKHRYSLSNQVTIKLNDGHPTT